MGKPPSQPLPGPPEPSPEPLGKGLKLEFRLKVLQQFTNLSIAGAGLSLTLIGTVLERQALTVWIPVLMFLTAAMLSMVGQIRVTTLAEDDSPILPKAHGWVGVIAYFLGAGIASLCFVVFKGVGVS